MAVHPHGTHECYCPSCGYKMDVSEYEKCRDLTCPVCGDRMRASTTGEFRGSIAQGGSAASMLGQILAATVIVGTLLYGLYKRG